MQKEKIIIEDYNPQWALHFQHIKSFLSSHLHKQILNIEHVGSTSVIGMKAKPIIDIDIIIESDEHTLQKVIARLQSVGYNYLGDLGISGREAFRFIGSNKKLFRHNLYVCREDSIALANHLALKCYLQENQSRVSAYSILKQELANKYPYDIESYIDGKTNFILGALRAKGLKDSDVKLIQKQNSKTNSTNY